MLSVTYSHCVTDARRGVPLAILAWRLQYHLPLMKNSRAFCLSERQRMPPVTYSHCETRDRPGVSLAILAWRRQYHLPLMKNSRAFRLADIQRMPSATNSHCDTRGDLAVIMLAVCFSMPLPRAGMLAPAEGLTRFEPLLTHAPNATVAGRLRTPPERQVVNDNVTGA